MAPIADTETDRARMQCRGMLTERQRVVGGQMVGMVSWGFCPGKLLVYIYVTQPAVVLLVNKIQIVTAKLKPGQSFTSTETMHD